MTINDDFNIDQALSDELTPNPQGNGNESGKTDDKGQGSPAGTGGNQDTEKETFKWTDGRMVTPTEAQRLLHEEFLPDYTKKSQELGELKKKPTDKQSTQGEDPNGTDDSPIDQATLKEFEKYASKLGYAKKTDLEQIVPRASGATLAQIELNRTLAQIETEFDGSQDQALGVAKPKVTGTEIMEYVKTEMASGNKVNLSPVQIAHILHPNEFAVYDAAKLGGTGSVKEKGAQLPDTEKAGNSGGGNPNPPLPKYDFDNGAQSMEKGLAEFFVTK